MGVGHDRTTEGSQGQAAPSEEGCVWSGVDRGCGPGWHIARPPRPGRARRESEAIDAVGDSAGGCWLQRRYSRWGPPAAETASL